MKKQTKIPRPEYPRMQFRRENAWINLNGVWDFSIDFGNSGMERGLWRDASAFDRKINVPFCPESELSGVGCKDFMESVFYHREVTFPKDWSGKRIFLNFGGVDYECTVWIDGHDAGSHSGGSSPFSLDVTQWARPGVKQNLFIHAIDRGRSREQGLGKQSEAYGSFGCMYTRTTGVWQTVWAEAVPEHGLLSCGIVPNFDAAEAVFTPRFSAVKPGDALRVTVYAAGKKAAVKELPAADGVPFSVSLPGLREWNPADPFLYDAKLSVVRGGKTVDSVESYFAMRKVSCENERFRLNNKPVYLRFVLDQGFYPDGIWTAPSDDELRKDIERSMAAGFNGARLHQKVFEDRFHYWADRLGYMTWAEYPSWGFSTVSRTAQGNFCADWLETVKALKNHPSILAWTPLNETGWEFKGNVDRTRNYREFSHHVYSLTRAADPSRPVNDSSGYFHVETDLWTVHSYRATPEEQRDFLVPAKDSPNPEDGEHREWLALPADVPVRVKFALETGYRRGMPYIIDEWGGFRYIRPEDRAKQAADAWGYNGLKFENPDEYLDRIRPQAELFASLPSLAGHCYTQLTDVEQEQNGVYTYARKPKVDVRRLHAVFSIKPEWSEW